MKERDAFQQLGYDLAESLRKEIERSGVAVGFILIITEGERASLYANLQHDKIAHFVTRYLFKIVEAENQGLK